MFEVLLSHTQYIARISEEHIAALNILCHILVFTFLEGFQFCGIIAFYPTSLIKAYWFPTTGRIVFIQQTVLNDLKLHLSHRTDNLTAMN